MYIYIYIKLSPFQFFCLSTSFKWRKRGIYICNVFSCWLRPDSAIQRKRPPPRWVSLSIILVDTYKVPLNNTVRIRIGNFWMSDRKADQKVHVSCPKLQLQRDVYKTSQTQISWTFTYNEINSDQRLCPDKFNHRNMLLPHCSSHLFTLVQDTCVNEVGHHWVR